MLKKIIHFIKYNNAAVIILAVILILGGGALGADEVSQFYQLGSRRVKIKQ